MLEIWQADARGASVTRRTSAALPNSGSRFRPLPADANGGYAFDNHQSRARCPIPTAAAGPHLLIGCSARHVVCISIRGYFDGEADNAADPVLALVPSDRRATLIRVREPGTQRG